MKNMFSSWAKLTAAAVCALSLGSCSRAEYAVLPKSAAPYHGVHRAATPVPVTATPVAASSPSASEPTTPASPAATAFAPSPSAQATGSAPQTAAATPAPAVATAPVPARKPNVMQRLALKKVTRKLDKMMQKSAARQHDNTASTAASGISGNLRTGLILLLVGVLVGILSPLVGSIIAIIGLVFIILWLLDQA